MVRYEQIRREDLPACTALATRSFMDYEYFSNYFPEKNRRRRFLEKMLEIEFRLCFGKTDIWGAWDGDVLCAVALLCPPEWVKPSAWQYMRAGYGKVFLAGGIRRVSDWDDMNAAAMKPCHAEKNAWYRSSLTVDADQEGQGIGSRMLRECLVPRVRSRGGKRLVLFTNSEDNRHFYEKNGFWLFREESYSYHGKTMGSWSYAMDIREEEQGMIWQEETKLRLNDFDQYGNLRDEALFQVLESAGSHHSDYANDSVIAGSQTGIVWILSEWRVRITRRPRSNETLYINTWARGKAPAAMIYRDFIVNDDEGNELLRAEAAFVLLDTAKGRLTRITEELFQAYQPREQTVFDDKPGRLRAPEVPQSTCALSLRRSDIDYNGHVHNTRYLDLAREALPGEILRKQFEQIRVLYSKAVTPQDEVTAQYTEENGVSTVAILANGTVCAVLEFQ